MRFSKLKTGLRYHKFFRLDNRKLSVPVAVAGLFHFLRPRSRVWLVDSTARRIKDVMLARVWGSFSAAIVRPEGRRSL